MASEFRSLTSQEIAELTDRGCTCSDWSKVRVAEGFDPATVRRTQFGGHVKLGVFERQVAFFGGVKKRAGISDATIHNCTIGNNVYISAVRNYIANYIIEDEAVIDNIDLLATEGESCFGNGTQVAVVNEAGGREIPIFDRMSAHVAYIMTFYRHRKGAIDNLGKMVAAYTDHVRSPMGIVGKGARLTNCRTIRNVRIGPAALIDGASRLENGSINSCPEDPVHIGSGVYAKDFIICSGSHITEGAVVADCFVGQGVELSKQYSAEKSVFFANCGGYHGEACAIFAGPYTVTHHKSTLLIAGYFSFLNAGSGTNQSNHMYKLGPNHQGVVERGSKTASDSYMLWPARVGAFTVVMGRHYRNSDTSDMPFSYLVENEDESILAPGVNLRSVGTVRDARKWPKRDRRKAPKLLDHINFKLLSPYTVQKMIRGQELLRNLRAVSGENTEFYTYNNVRISRPSLERGIALYEIGIDKYLGNCLIGRLERQKIGSRKALGKALQADSELGRGKWLDLAGLLAPQEAVESLLDGIEGGQVGSLEEVAAAFEAMHNAYQEYEWTWAASVIERRTGKKVEEMSAEELIGLIERWRTAVVELDRMLAQDAKKEFTATARIGFGIDGDEQAQQADFEQVRGRYDDNSFVREIDEHIAAKTALAERTIEQLRKLA